MNKDYKKLKALNRAITDLSEQEYYNEDETGKETINLLCDLAVDLAIKIDKLKKG